MIIFHFGTLKYITLTNVQTQIIKKKKLLEFDSYSLTCI